MQINSSRGSLLVSLGEQEGFIFAMTCLPYASGGGREEIYNLYYPFSSMPWEESDFLFDSSMHLVLIEHLIQPIILSPAVAW